MPASVYSCVPAIYVCKYMCARWYVLYIHICTISVIYYVYVRVASRNRTLAHIRRFEKMADEVGMTKNRLYWFT